MPETRRRSPAQVQASRRNGARSKGPVTPEGKECSSRNALKHGLCAMRHLVLEDEVPDDLEELIGAIVEETGAATEIEARIARRLAVAFWKGERAERMEVALLDAAPRLRPPTVGGTWEEADPLATFDVRRFNAVRGHQAAQGREISRCLKELRALRKDARENDTREPDGARPDEPKMAWGNEPGGQGPANDDDAPAARTREPEATPRNEPESPPLANEDAVIPATGLLAGTDGAPDEPEPESPPELPQAIWEQVNRLMDADDWPGLARLAATGAFQPFGLEPADFASRAALGRAIYRGRGAGLRAPERTAA